MRHFYEVLAGTSALMLALAVGCNDDPQVLGGSGPPTTASGSTGSGNGTGGDGGETSTSSSGGESSVATTTASTTNSTSTGMGGSGNMAYAAPGVGVEDVNATSSSFGDTVSAITFANQVSGWFFGHST